MIEKNCIEVQGARVHNLKNIDVKIPRDELVVITGLSGSGKSSLAFDTIYAEGQRRYMETFSAYIRQFLGNMERPKSIKSTDFPRNCHRAKNDLKKSSLYRGDHYRIIRLPPLDVCPYGNRL